MKTRDEIYAMIEEAAESWGLETIETTSSATGYPQDLKLAVCGFESWEQAEKFVEENRSLDFKLIHTMRRDGWQYAYRNGNSAWEAYTLTSEDSDEIEEGEVVETMGFYDDSKKYEIVAVGDYYDCLRDEDEE